MEKVMLSEHFSNLELMCKCGCGNIKIDPKLLTLLERIRIFINKPIIILSGYRCPGNNAKTPKASKNSKHCLGQAADIAVNGIDHLTLHKMIREWAMDGLLPELGGLGKYTDGRKLVHVDVRPKANNRFAEWENL